jgi:hypothetical protein
VADVAIDLYHTTVMNMYLDLMAFKNRNVQFIAVAKIAMLDAQRGNLLLVERVALLVRNYVSE